MMKTKKIVMIASRGFIFLSALSFLYVSMMAFVNPQAVMDLVHVDLGLHNTDAFSSIRGVYGGVGLALVVTLVYLAVRNPKQGLVFLMLIWGLYAFSRILTIGIDGPLGAFGSQWLSTELFFFGIATLLRIAGRKVFAAQIVS
jgi:hypothetical protein